MMGFLIKCRTCGKEVSSTAKMCPHCGERSPEPYMQRLKYSLIGITGLSILAVVVFAIFLLMYELNILN
jgi:hypothetical protein